MTKQIDCLLIGQNIRNLVQEEANTLVQGKNSGTYRELRLHSLYYQDNPISIQELFSDLLEQGKFKGLDIQTFKFWNSLSLANAVLANYLMNREMEVEIIRSFQNDKEMLKQILLNDDILLIAITTTIYVSSDPIIEIIRFIREYNPDVKIAVGGPFILKQFRALDEKALNYLFKNLGADYYINNAEGEKTLYELVSRLKHQNSYENLDNLAYRHNGAFRFNPNVPENNPLDQDIIDWSRFNDRMGKFAAVRTSISCPFNCSFCAFPVRMGKFRTSSLETIERELDSLNSVESLECVDFIDDTFNIPKKRFQEVLKLMIRKKYRFKWHSFLRCQYADEETLDLMREAGCLGVILGIESASDNILENMNKKVTVDDYKRGMELLQKSGIMSFASLIMGFPGETEQTARESIEFIKQYQPDFYRFHLWYCDPVSPIWEKREQYGIKGFQHDWSHATMNSQQAADLMDEAFLSISGEESIWLPLNGFQFDGVFEMLHNGISIDRIKNYIKLFNMAVRDRLQGSDEDNISDRAFERIVNAFA